MNNLQKREAIGTCNRIDVRSLRCGHVVPGLVTQGKPNLCLALRKRARAPRPEMAQFCNVHPGTLSGL
jgi:hypothetical protein